MKYQAPLMPDSHSSPYFGLWVKCFLNWLLHLIFALDTRLIDRFKATRVMVVHQSLDLRFSIAERAARMLPDRERIELRLEGIVNQKSTDQRLALF
jgi:hypothetical protein